jgi:hypothetical protein
MLGKQFGNWTVICHAGRSHHSVPQWLCRCKCGTERPVLQPSLLRGASVSCGCRGKACVPGEKFSRLVVVAAAERAPCGERQWLCRCNCGEECVVLQSRLTLGITRSCGCLAKENSRTHGMRRAPEYSLWCGMVARCHRVDSKNYARYGARGISVCDRWRHSFENFYADVGPRPAGTNGRRPLYSLERINNNGNYEPGNVRWATAQEQAANTRRSRFTPAEVAVIRGRLGAGEAPHVIARSVGDRAGLVRRIALGLIWRTAEAGFDGRVWDVARPRRSGLSVERGQVIDELARPLSHERDTRGEKH